MPGHGGFTVFKSTDNHLWKAKVAGPGARQGIFGDSFLRFNNQKNLLIRYLSDYLLEMDLWRESRLESCVEKGRKEER